MGCSRQSSMDFANSNYIKFPNSMLVFNVIVSGFGGGAYRYAFLGSKD